MHTMNAGMEVTDPIILNVRTRQMYVVSFTPSMFYLQSKSPGTYWVSGWVGLHTLPLPEIKPQLLTCPASCPLITVHKLHMTLKSQ